MGERFPGLVIAGAPKCGTSSLFEWLKLHPEVAASRPKETHFLADEPDPERVSYHRDGLDAYGRYFHPREEQRLLLEATPGYLYQRTPLQVLPSLPGQPRVIMLLRAPAQRVWSAFRYEKYNLRTVPAAMDFPAYLNTERGRKNIEQSSYARFLQPWQEALGERLRVLLFEDLVHHPAQLLAGLCRWLDLDESAFQTQDFTARNSTRQWRYRRLHAVGERLGPYLPAPLVNRLLPWYQRWNANAAPAALPQEQAALAELGDEFAQSNTALTEQFGLNLSPWGFAAPEEIPPNAPNQDTAS